MGALTQLSFATLSEKPLAVANCCQIISSRIRRFALSHSGNTDTVTDFQDVPAKIAQIVSQQRLIVLTCEKLSKHLDPLEAMDVYQSLSTLASETIEMVQELERMMGVHASRNGSFSASASKPPSRLSQMETAATETVHISSFVALIRHLYYNVSIAEAPGSGEHLERRRQAVVLNTDEHDLCQ